jgi:hypothetical protein
MRPILATPNEVRLDLRTMVLRDYGKPGGIPTLVDAPHAGHTDHDRQKIKSASFVERELNGVRLRRQSLRTHGHGPDPAFI